MHGADTSMNKSPRSAVDVPVDPPLGAAQPGLGLRVFKNTTAILGGRVIGLAFSAATSVLLARFLGQERLGEYGAVYAYLALYGFLATFCVDQVLVREVSLRRGQAG